MAKITRTLPRKCECGGRLKYTWEFNQWWVTCLSCTPAMSVTVPVVPQRKDAR